MDMKHIAVSAIVALVVSVIGVALWSPEPSTVVKEVQKLGSVSPDFASPFIRFGGVTRYAFSTNNLTQGSATVCSIQSPAATSTLISGGIRFDVASSSVLQVELGKATTNSATTTSLGVYSVPANTQATLLASTTNTGLYAGDGLTVFSPNTFFNVKAGTAGGGTPSGHCHAVFEAYN